MQHGISFKAVEVYFAVKDCAHFLVPAGQAAGCCTSPPVCNAATYPPPEAQDTLGALNGEPGSCWSQSALSVLASPGHFLLQMRCQVGVASLD